MLFGEAILASLVLNRPILVSTIDSNYVTKKLNSCLKTWPDINDCQITTNKTTNGISIYQLDKISIENQKLLFKNIRNDTYPLILVFNSNLNLNFYLDKTLKKILLFNYTVEINDLLEVPTLLKNTQLSKIKSNMNNINIVTEVKTYIYDLIVEIRYSRFIESGIPTSIMKDLINFIKFKTLLLNMNYVTPLIVKNCVKVQLPLHLKLITANDDPSILYGTKPELTNQLLQVLNVDDIIDIAISNIIPPL